MSKPPLRFLSLLTRPQLAEMLAPSYGKLRNLDLNEAYLRLDAALHTLQLIEGVQRAAWGALQDKKPDWDETKLLDHISKKLSKSRRYQSATVSTSDEGPWMALTVLMDQGAGVSSGEALDLLESPAGQKLLQKGFSLAGKHLAKELLR